MKISMRRISALFLKELKDFSKNTSASMVVAIPIIICILLNNMSETFKGGYIPNLIQCMGITLSMVATLTMGGLIAEEKEKNTMRTLVLSGISPVEFLLGKAIMVFIITGISNGAIFFISGAESKYFMGYIIITSLVAITMIIIGGIIGLLAENQKSMSVIGTPITFLMYLGPMIVGTNESFKGITRCLPIDAVNKIIISMLKGKGIVQFQFEIMVLFVWIILTTVVFVMLYNKRGIDK